MNTNKTKNLFRTLGVLAMAGALLGLGGCASPTKPAAIKKISAAYADKPEGVMVIGFPPNSGARSATAQEICAEFPGDARCKNIDQYKGETIWLGENNSITAEQALVQVLIPKDVVYTAGLFFKTALIQARIKGDAPAYFEAVIPEGWKDAGTCDLVGIYNRGVVCPSLNYDYRDVKGYGFKDTR
jgi:hypothetical protein